MSNRRRNVARSTLHRFSRQTTTTTKTISFLPTAPTTTTTTTMIIIIIPQQSSAVHSQRQAGQVETRNPRQHRRNQRKLRPQQRKRRPKRRNHARHQPRNPTSLPNPQQRQYRQPNDRHYHSASLPHSSNVHSYRQRRHRLARVVIARQHCVFSKRRNSTTLCLRPNRVARRRRPPLARRFNVNNWRAVNTHSCFMCIFNVY
jgi:hypothetical protein